MHLRRSNVTIVPALLPLSHRGYSDIGIPTGGILTRYSDKGIATGDILTGGIPTWDIPTGFISCEYSHRWYQMHLGLGNATINVRPFVAFKHYYINRKFTSVS